MSASVNLRPSDIKKDQSKSIRVSSEVLEALDKKGLSVQKAFDIYIDTMLTVTKPIVKVKGK